MTFFWHILSGHSCIIPVPATFLLMLSLSKKKKTFPIACTLALTGTVIHHSCPNSPVTLMISDSFRSNISVAHTISRGCARLFQRMFEPRWGNVCVRFKHHISSCKQQAIQPQVSNRFLTGRELIGSHPSLTVYTDMGNGDWYLRLSGGALVWSCFLHPVEER